MKVLFDSQDLWEIVEDGYGEPASDSMLTNVPSKVSSSRRRVKHGVDTSLESLTSKYSSAYTHVPE